MGNSYRIGERKSLGNARRARLTPLFSRLFFLALCMALTLIAPVSKAGAQESAPAGASNNGPGSAPNVRTESQVQLAQPPSSPSQATPPITVTLQDALDRARKLDPQYLGALSDAKSAGEDRLQARNAMLPTISATTQYLNTQGDGGRISDGRFVTSDGVHVYRAWGVFHQDLSPGTLMGTGLNRAKALEAVAKAKAEIARRGLTVTVSRNFYALVVAQRKYATTQLALDEATHFLDITQAGERQGQLPHSDAIKAEIQYRIQRQAFEESRLTMEDARLNLAVLLFPTLNENFSVVDDLDSAQTLPPLPEVQAMAEKENPDLRVAMETVRASNLDITAAKTAFLPTLNVDTDYGIEANCFALRCSRASFPDVGVVPNLGYFLTAVLNIPVWDWGTLRSKLHQAEYKQQQAKVQLSQAQRQIVSQLYASYNEAAFARAAVEEARRTAELAAESLRLINLRYQGGLSTALDVVDSENTSNQARNAYIDAQARYRAALAGLQTLTGSF